MRALCAIRGVLLYGPPGCGKTMFGKAAASVLARLHGKAVGEHTMMHIKGPEIQSPYVGVTEAIVRDVFAYARAYKALHGYPMVVFIDEADAILPSRDGAGTGRRALPWEESNVATFLTEMDGLEDSGALVILATNRPHAIDAAILRDGRCDRKIKVERPTQEAAVAIFAKCLKGIPLAEIGAGELASRAAEYFFSPGHRLLRINSERGAAYLTLGMIGNGAMIVGLVERAKAIAFHRDLLAGGKAPSGIGWGDIRAAIDAVLAQSMNLNHADALDEYCETHGLTGMQVARIQPAPYGLDERGEVIALH